VVLMRDQGFSFPLAALVAVGVSVLVGLFNGALIAGLGLQPIVATLITMVAGRGVAMLLTSAEPVSHRDALFEGLGGGHFLALPVSVWVVALVFLLAFLLSRRTAFGLFVAATGDNEAACRMSGVPIERVKLAVYGFSGFCAGIAGLIAASYIATADPDRIGRMSELDAIFAVVVGGTGLGGGRFYLWGTVIGALLIQTLSLTMYSQHVPAAIEPMPKAVVIILICLLLAPKFRERLPRLSAFRSKAGV
jgi:simple sugar transport system permease protein